MIKKLLRHKRRKMWRKRYELRGWMRTMKMLSSKQFELPEDCAVEGMIVIPGVR